MSALTLRRPLRKKLRMRWFFDVSEVKASSFFKSALSDPPPQIFDARLIENTNLSSFELKTLKNFCFDQEVQKKGQFQIELLCSQSLESLAEFPTL